MNKIQVKDVNGVRILILNRPEKRNAIDLEMYTQLTEYLIQGNSDNDIRAFMIRGQADCFTAGNDLKDFLKHTKIDPEHPAFRFLFTLLDITKPIVAAVAGAAVGIGTTLLLHCDLVYADKSAKFQLPFVNLALVPEAASSLLLAQTVGAQKAAELLLLGESFNAETASSLNIINDILPSETLFDVAFNQAAKLASLPPQALQASRRLMRGNTDAIRTQMLAELNEFSIRLQSDEAKARFHAFLNKK
ncbi:enoyl-CoA hydratase-related protein [Shewanella surugensis]|uniref:Enoyl-CoA hydratase-related protein n=1 Tax=Shewanella surugensis TaxID=212020 RepID=A0ABT0LFE6_9GAMM|nr:enoyl-CoA hydratase-related protein [Shewanella surugensis]MCL1126421.1 enoyl-CoA hydratase-related protein [Shewanella surugensis]